MIMGGKYAYHNMKDYHVKSPLGMGFYTGNPYWNPLKLKAEADGVQLPTLPQQLKIDILLNTISPVIAVCDWAYLTLNNTSSDFYKYNIVNPNTFKLTGSPTKTSNQGVKSAASSYLDTGWDYGDRIKYSQNSGSAGAYVFTDGSDGASAMGAILSATDRTIALNTRDASNRVSGAGINAASILAGSGGSVTNDVGLHIVNRIDSGNQTHYLNNIQTATGAAASIAPTGVDVSLLARNFNGTRGSFFTRDVAFFFCGAGLDATLRTILNTGLAAYVASPE